MKLKKILSGFLAAAMAVTTMVTATFNAGAAVADRDLTIGSVPSTTLEEDSYTAGQIAKPSITLDNKWASATSLEGYSSVVATYTCEHPEMVKNLYLVAQNGTVNWLAKSASPAESGTITLSLSNAQDKTYQAIVFLVEPTETYSIGDDFDAGVEVTSAKLVAAVADTTEYVGQPLPLPTFAGNTLKFSGTFDKTKIAGPGAYIEVKWTSASDVQYGSGVKLIPENDFTDANAIATANGNGSLGEQTSKFMLSDIKDKIQEKMWLSSWGAASIESVTIYNDKTKGDVYTAPTSSIGADNFTFSTYKNVSMKIGDKFTITFDSVVNGLGIPAGATFDFKYKVPDATAEGGFAYYAPVLNSAVNGTEGQDITGLKVTSETSGTQTIFTFTAVSASTCDDPFMVNVETVVDGERDYLGFTDDMGYMVLASGHTITVDTEIKNGTVKTDKTTAAKDETVTLTVTPAVGYELGTLTVTEKTSGDEVTVTNKTFTMPDDDVTVTATFKAPLTGIKLDEKATVLVGAEKALTATKLPDGTADTTAITWSSNKEDIVTVSAAGVVKGVAAGTATITATCGTFTATCEVTVSDKVISCTAIALDKTTADVKKGESVTLTATPTPADTTDDITWESSAPAVATVKDGVVTGVARGKATITVKCGDQTATCEVSVTEDKTVTAPVAAGGQKSYDVVSTAADGTKVKTVDTVYAITEADLACKGYKVTITNTSNGKSITREITNAYKSVTVKSAEDLGNDTFTGYFLVVRVKNVPENVTLSYKFDKIS